MPGSAIGTALSAPAPMSIPETCHRLRLPRPGHGQHDLQGRAAKRSGRQRQPDAARPGQAGERPQPRCPGGRHHLHAGAHRNPVADRIASGRRDVRWAGQAVLRGRGCGSCRPRTGCIHARRWPARHRRTAFLPSSLCRDVTRPHARGRCTAEPGHSWPEDPDSLYFWWTVSRKILPVLYFKCRLGPDARNQLPGPGPVPAACWSSLVP